MTYLYIFSYVSLPQWIPGLTIKDIEVYRMKDSSPQGMISDKEGVFLEVTKITTIHIPCYVF